MQYASMVERRTSLFVHPWDQADSGVLLATGPVTTLACDVDDHDLGQVVLDTLKLSKRGVPHPTNWSGVPHPLYKPARVTSWKALMKGAKQCALSDDGKRLTLVPTRNAGPREGFQDLTELAFYIPSTSTYEEVGRALRRAIKLAK